MLAQTASKVRAHVEEFSGIVSAGLCKPARRFVGEALYGIMARQSVRLSEIGRALEEPIALAKTATRLSRNLGRPALEWRIGAALLREGARRIGQRTLLILDLSDIIKPHARAMEYLAEVRDGSTKTIGNGYWLCQVIGVETGDAAITPLYGTLYSQTAAGFVSENHEMLRAIDRVGAATHGRGVWVIDRGGDRGELYAALLAKGRAFVVRQLGTRHLLAGGRKLATAALAEDCPMHYATHVVRERAGAEASLRLDYGCRPVRLPEHPDVPLWLVVVRGFGADPLMLLTDLPMRKKRAVLWWLVSAYLTRWRIEDTIRFVKQSYDLEDIRVLSYQRLRNLVALVTAASFFTAVVLGARVKLDILASHLLTAAKRIFGVPDFRYYALADGIRELCTRHPRRGPANPTSTDPPQLTLALA